MTKLSENKQVQAKVVEIRRPRRSASAIREIREASTGQVVVCLPRIWAVAGRGLQRCSAEQRAGSRQSRSPEAEREAQAASPRPELAFYRKYTEALLRRYLRLSLEAGRVPSLMGREMFRGNVTHYRVNSFEDVVIFCHDVEKRLGQLRPLDQQLVKRIGLQQYTQAEAAGMLGLDLNRTVRRYLHALDLLTELFLDDRLLEPQR
jgi:hypothetical protein